MTAVVPSESESEPQTSASTAGGWTYQPALDGVRALAVVAVVLFHFWQDLFPGGFIGVDVFFVMSGYLITGILLAEHRATGGIRLAPFWRRRVRRLVPAVLVLVPIVTFGTYLADGWSARQFADSVGALTWTTNIVESVWRDSRVFTANSDTVLDHLWSLAIEEQFYLLWPPLVGLLVGRVSSVRTRTMFVLAAIAASATVMWSTGVFGAYFRTDARAFELLIGALVAIVPLRLPVTRSTPVALVAGVGLAAFVGFGDTADDWMYPWGFLAVAATAAALVAAAASPAPAVRNVLCWSPLRAVGQRSYGVYLWHIPVLRILSESLLGIGGIGLTAIRFVVLAGLVEASYRFVEQPIRSGRFRPTAAAWGLAYVAVAASLVPLGVVAVDEVRSQWDATTDPPRAAPGQTKVLAIGDGLAFGALVPLVDLDDYAVWSLVDPGCPSVTAGEFRTGSRQFTVSEECGHWQRRAERATQRFRPQVAIVGYGLIDTLALRTGSTSVQGADLRAVYADAIRAQIRSTDPAGVVMIRVADPSRLFGRNEGSAEARRAASKEYLAAFDRVVAEEVEAGRPIEVLEVGGTPDLDAYVAEVERRLSPLIDELASGPARR